MANRMRGTAEGNDLVRVGSWVEVRDGQMDECWRIVDASEADPARHLISATCPLARALLGHQAAEQVRVQSPEGRRLVTILHVG